MRVLLVEDDEPVAESLTRGLGRYGFEVEWVRTGAAGYWPSRVTWCWSTSGCPTWTGSTCAAS